MAAMAWLVTLAKTVMTSKILYLHSRDDPTIIPDFGRDLLEAGGVWVINQSSMSCRRKKDAVLYHRSVCFPYDIPMVISVPPSLLCLLPSDSCPYRGGSHCSYHHTAFSPLR
jgi:hypothetical protein